MIFFTHLWFGIISFLRVRGKFLGVLFFVTLMFTIESSLWSSLMEHRTSIAGYTSEKLLAYSFAALSALQICNLSTDLDDLSELIESGTLSSYLLNPAGFLRLRLAHHLGQAIVRGLMFIPCMSLFAYAVIDFSYGYLNTAFYLGLVLVGSALNLLISYSLATLTFFFKDSYAFVQFKDSLFWILSGSLIPLDFFPDWASQLMTFFPPAYIAFFPSKVLIGEVSFATSATGGLVFLTLSYLLFCLIWKLGLRRYQANGG